MLCRLFDQAIPMGKVLRQDARKLMLELHIIIMAFELFSLRTRI